MSLRLTLWLLLLAPGAARADGWLPAQSQLRHVRLLEAPAFVPLLLGQNPNPTSLAQMTRDQLMLEKRRLEDEIPGLGGPIAVLCVGGGGLLIGSLYLWLGFNTGSALSSGGVAGVFITFGAIGIAVGVIGCAAGILWLLSRLNERGPLQAHAGNLVLEDAVAPGLG